MTLLIQISRRADVVDDQIEDLPLLLESREDIDSLFVMSLLLWNVSDNCHSILLATANPSW